MMTSPAVGRLAAAVYYFPDTGLLRSAESPLDDFEPLITCGLSFYNHVELPAPESGVVQALALSKDERDTYYDISDMLRNFAFPERWHRDQVSKLFGWPDLVQGDLDAIRYPASPDSRPTLLLQIGWYHNGAKWECWGPGGAVYFTLDERELAAARFASAELEMQCT